MVRTHKKKSLINGDRYKAGDSITVMLDETTTEALNTQIDKIVKELNIQIKDLDPALALKTSNAYFLLKILRGEG